MRRICFLVYKSTGMIWGNIHNNVLIGIWLYIEEGRYCLIRFNYCIKNFPPYLSTGLSLVLCFSWRMTQYKLSFCQNSHCLYSLLSQRTYNNFLIFGSLNLIHNQNNSRIWIPWFTICHFSLEHVPVRLGGVSNYSWLAGKSSIYFKIHNDWFFC